MDLPSGAFSPEKVFLHLEDGGMAIPLEVTPTFWPDLINADKEGKLGTGWLVTYNRMDGPADHWENHPNGDEIFHVLEGTLGALLDDGNSERVVEMHPGDSFVIPAATWHTVVAQGPSVFIGFTYGHGTETRPLGES